MPPTKLTQEQIEKRRLYARQYYTDHRERKQEHNTNYQRKNKNRVNERHRQWYAENKETERARSREKERKAREADKEGYNRRMREWRQKNYERCRAVEWARDLKKKYGLTIEKYHELLDATKGKCPICEREFKGKGGAVIDHCHNTGVVRGIMCSNCNRAEGLLGTLENAQRLVDYMRCNEIFYKNGNPIV